MLHPDTLDESQSRHMSTPNMFAASMEIRVFQGAGTKTGKNNKEADDPSDFQRG